MHPSIGTPTAVALTASAFLSLTLARPSDPVAAPGPEPSDPVQESPSTVGTRLLDLDGDGALDLLGLHADGSLSVQRNVGSRRFVLVAQQLPRAEVQDVLCTDLDGDTLPDLYLVSAGADLALLGEGGGRFRDATAELGLGESGFGLSAERLDVDGDGLQDLLVHNRGSDVLFWAQGNGAFAREERTRDGRETPVPMVPGSSFVEPAASKGAQSGADATSGTSPIGIRQAHAASVPVPSARSGLVAAPLPPSTTAPTMGISLDARYVNDDLGEVGSADIVDGSLTGADVSTSSGDVTFNGAVVTALKGTFGQASIASGLNSTVSGGYRNKALGTFSTVSGGGGTARGNTAGGSYSTVSGGGGYYGNTATGARSTVSGGGGYYGNHATGHYSTVSGGGGNRGSNVASGDFSTVSGGGGHTGGNVASGAYSTVGGGGGPSFTSAANTASGVSSTVPGGASNTASAAYTFAAGRRAKANHDGSFVWGDSSDVNKLSSAVNQFNIFAEGGARIFAVGQTTPSLVVDPAGNVGVGTAAPAFTLEVNGSAGKPGGGAWSVSSDARLKKNVQNLEGALETLLALRGVSYEYKDPEAIHELAGTRFGFIAQEVEQVIADWVEEGSDGYKRLAIRGFEALAVESLRELRAEKDRQIAALEARVRRLESVETEVASPNSAPHGVR